MYGFHKRCAIAALSTNQKYCRSLPSTIKIYLPSEYTLVLYFLLELTKLGWILDGTNSAGNTNTATHGILIYLPGAGTQTYCKPY